MTYILLWLGSGFICSMLARWSLALAFGRFRITLGTIICFMLGTAFMPLPLIAAIGWFLCWAFDGPDSQQMAVVKWPKGWYRFRYAQHRFARNLWYLGNPPDEEDTLSGWRNYDPTDNA